MTHRDTFDALASDHHSRLIRRTRRVRSQQKSPRVSPNKSRSPATGRVAWFNAEIGVGYISSDDGRSDCFVHGGAVRGQGKILEGARVAFEIVPGSRGPAARNVAILTR